MDITNYSLKPGIHSGKPVIWIQFPNDKKLIAALKQRFPSAKWSRSQRGWYLPDFPTIRALLNMKPKDVYMKSFQKIHPINIKAMESFIHHLQLKAYSTNTIRIYVGEFAHLLNLLGNHDVTQLSPQKLKNYFLYCLEKERMNEVKLNGKINAIKFYFEQVLHQEKMFFDIPRPKKPQTLPRMLTQSEIKRLFSVVSNIKHLLALQLSYGMGLRVSELVNLKLEHINSKDRIVIIKNAKGKKDRYVPLPECIVPLLKTYYHRYYPKDYLFEGAYGGSYSKTSVQHVFKKAMKKAMIKKNIGVHGLRHSYATHLLESGTDIRFIQELI